LLIRRTAPVGPKRNDYAAYARMRLFECCEPP